MTDAAQATDALIRLLRLGEHLAEGAFKRITRAFAGTPMNHFAAILEEVSIDERRHDRLLAPFERGDATLRFDRQARRFFIAMCDSDPSIHLARIASLDGCVCQIITRVVAGDSQRLLQSSLQKVLVRIRSDEARHVRITRRMALESGMQASQMNAIDAETRAAFGAVLARYTDEFERLGVNPEQLLRSINRVG